MASVVHGHILLRALFARSHEDIGNMICFGIVGQKTCCVIANLRSIHWLQLPQCPWVLRLNDFIRICLGLELEPFLKTKGRANQQAGGQNKGSSILTEAERLDVRKEIARIAGVSVGNITKVKQLTTTAHSDLIKALRDRELSIHRAWLWSKLSPEEQRDNLWLNQSKRRIGKTIRHLLSPCLPKNSPPALDVDDLIELVSALQSGDLASVTVVSINVPGKAILVTEELVRTLEAQQKLALTCATSTR